MGKVYIAAAKRTAIGSFNGSLSAIPAVDFGAEVVKAIIAETKIPTGRIDEVISGNVLTACTGQGPGRQVSIKAGILNTVPAFSLNMVCGSALKAIMLAYTNIKAGAGDVYIAGGTENMSAAPYLIPSARQGLRMGNKEIVDHMVFDALTDAFSNAHMGITAENVAERYGITREEQDAFAYASQQRAIAAVDNGRFDGEVVPVAVKSKKNIFVFDRDEYPNRTTTPEKLAALRPAFKENGTVTAGNASGINDGAAYLLIVSESAVEKYGLKPLTEIIGIGQGGVEPSIMGLGPVPAIRAALKNANLTLKDIDIIELNEAFAAQSLGVVTELAAEHGIGKGELLAKTNLHGGALALGHPVGASGARITVTLTHLIAGGDYKTGLASLCIGGGMGMAVIIQKI